MFKKSFLDKSAIVTFITAAIGFVASCVMFWIAQQWEKEHINAEFHRVFAAKATAFEREINLNLELFTNAVSFYHASNFVSSDEFRIFAMENIEHHSGIHAIAWVNNIEASDATERRLVINYIEPYELFQTNIGRDVSEINQIRHVLQNTAEHQLSSFSLSFTRPDDQKSRIISIALPVYKIAGNVQDSLVGYIFGELKIDTIFEHAVAKIHTMENQLNVWLVDAQSDKVIYHRASQDTEATSLFLDHDIIIGDHKWVLRATASNTFFNARATHQPQIILTVSLLLTIFLAAYIFSVLRKQRSIEQIVAIRTNELEHSERKLRTILDSAANGFMLINNEGIITLINPAATAIFGYEADELIGKRFSVLFPSNKKTKDETQIDQLRSEILDKAGVNLETSAVRKNGSDIPISVSVTHLQYNNELFYVCVMLDITERMQNDKMKSEFISTVSHELRTPLTSINGSLKLILSQFKELPATAIELLKIANRNTERQLNLVNDLLDFQRLSTGEMKYHFENLNLTELALSACEAMQGICDSYGVKINFRAPPQDLIVKADKFRLTQVVSNLLSNALKFSPPHSQVTLLIDRDGENARLSVIDQGPGIPEHFRERIFKRFAQADSSDQRRSSGTGLGLAISKELIEAMKGQINYISLPQRGSTFFILLPLISLDTDNTQAQQSDELVET